MHDDAERWNARYDGRVTGEPSMPKGLGGIELERGGRCLDVACGLGEQTIWAAQQGYEVIALDVSDHAITALNGAALIAGVRDRIETKVLDLEQGLPAELLGAFDLVICQRYRQTDLYDHLVYVLRPGGVLVVTVLSEVGLDGDPGPFHAPPGELVDAFRHLDLTILRHVEMDGEATLVARRTA